MFWTVALLFQIRVGGLQGPQQVLLGTVSEAAIFLCEVPTGVVADVYSRRLSVVVGMAVCGAAFLVQGLVPVWPAMVVGMALWGVGETFLSGAREAWLADEMASVGREGEVAATFVLGSRWSNVGTVVGSWASVGLAQASLSLPPVASGVLFLAMSVAVRLAWPESGFHGSTHQGRMGLLSTARSGLALTRANPVLLGVLGLIVLGGLASEGFDRLWVAHLDTAHGLPPLGGLGEVAWFALLATASMAFAWTVLGLMSRWLAGDRPAYRAVLGWIHGGIALGIAGFALAGSFAGALSFWLLARSLRRATEPLRNAWLNSEAEPAVRATMLSFGGQAHSLGEIGGGLTGAAIAAWGGVRAALLLSSALAAAAGLWARSVRRRGD
jgi:DHA3 family tetracycline resistance protein-like MFS transporter